jgi:hypothetical protein
MTIRVDASYETFLPVCSLCPGWGQPPSLSKGSAWSAGVDHQRRVHGVEDPKGTANAERQASRHA